MFAPPSWHTPAFWAAVLVTCVLATQVSVPFDDPHIIYSDEWTIGVFEIGDGDPIPPLSGPNSSVCFVGLGTKVTNVTGQNFSFQFTGTSVELVTESRHNHGVFDVTLDGSNKTRVSGYSSGLHCGVSFHRDGLELAPHTLQVVNVGPDAASQGVAYLELLKINYDDGSNSSVTPTLPAITGGAATSTPKWKASAGAIGGGIAGVLAAVTLGGAVVVMLRRRQRRRRRQAEPLPDLHELLASPWRPASPPLPPLTDDPPQVGFSSMPRRSIPGTSGTAEPTGKDSPARGAVTSVARSNTTTRDDPPPPY